MKNYILDRLTEKCPFPNVFQDLERGEAGLCNVPCRKIGHIRADYDGYRWWNTVWPCHPALAEKEISVEIDRTYEALTAGDALKSLDTLVRFCQAHPEACVDQQFLQEYNFYPIGKTCDFWIRFITRTQDYEELEKMIRAWNADDTLPKKRVDVEAITSRTEAIGGITLIWF